MKTGIPSLEALIAEIDREIGLPSSDREKKQPEPASFRKQYIRFLMGDMLMALPLSGASEIGHCPDITPLPHLPDWILGVSNIRGEIISVVDIKNFLGMPFQGAKRDSRFIIIRNKEMKVCLIVDKVIGIFSPENSEIGIQENPYPKGENASAYISGVVVTEDGLLNLLDIDKLLASPRMNAFRGEIP